MAISWTNVFTAIGKHVKYTDLFRTLGGTTIPGYRDAVITAYDGLNYERLLGDTVTRYNGRSSVVDSWCTDEARAVDTILSDPTLIVANLNTSRTDLGSLLPLVQKQFSVDAQTLLKCTTTLGSVTANGSNVGTGAGYATKLLDGYNRPANGAAANALYAGVNSELTMTSETVLAECVQDYQNDGVTSGSEQFRLSGGPAASGLGAYLNGYSEGSGQGPTLGTMQSAAINLNGDFETWSSSTAGSWTYTGGTAGSTIVRTTSTDKYRGTYGVSLVGNGVLATHQLDWTIPAGRVYPLQMLAISARVKASAAVGAGDLYIGLTGTGYTAGSSEKISVAHGSLPTSWTLYQAFVPLPSSLPTDLAFTIQVSGTLTNAKIVYLDDVYCAPVTYWAGVGWQPFVPGATAFMRRDKFTTTIANDGAGKFQRYLRRRYGLQLVSVAAAETISDSLAA